MDRKSLESVVSINVSMSDIGVLLVVLWNQESISNGFLFLDIQRRMQRSG